MSNIEQDFRVEPYKGGYVLQVWNDKRGMWTDLKGARHNCRIEADEAMRVIIEGLKEIEINT